MRAPAHLMPEDPCNSHNHLLKQTGKLRERPGVTPSRSSPRDSDRDEAGSLTRLRVSQSWMGTSQISAQPTTPLSTGCADCSPTEMKASQCFNSLCAPGPHPVPSEAQVGAFLTKMKVTGLTHSNTPVLPKHSI